MKVSWTGTRSYPAPATPRPLASGATEPGPADSACPTAIQHPFGVGQGQPAAVQQHREVVEHVGGLLGDAIVRLLARGAGDLLGLLLHLLADQSGVVEQRDG